MRTGLLTTLTLIVTAATADGPGDLEQLLATLSPDSGRAELHFTEQRDSSLLEEPLVVTGKLWRNDRGQLVRQTIEPRRETQKLSAGMVVIERPGQSPRNFSLSHAPELAVLHHALTALLAGDADALREHFEHELTRNDEGWQLTLRPRDEKLAERVETLCLSGAEGELERFVLALVDGERVTTRLERRP